MVRGWDIHQELPFFIWRRDSLLENGANIQEADGHQVLMTLLESLEPGMPKTSIPLAFKIL